MYITYIENYKQYFSWLFISYVAISYSILLCNTSKAQNWSLFAIYRRHHCQRIYYGWLVWYLIYIDVFKFVSPFKLVHNMYLFLFFQLACNKFFEDRRLILTKITAKSANQKSRFCIIKYRLTGDIKVDFRQSFNFARRKCVVTIFCLRRPFCVVA